MTNYTFRPAQRKDVNLLIGVAGGTGSGKTFTAMRLATGMAGAKRFAVIDTESGRASHYADQFRFDVCELRSPFTPQAYVDVIHAADDAGYPVIVVDSMSHEYAGEGGVLDMQEEEFARMGSRETSKVASWIKPKTEHKRFMQRLLQVQAHMILCFRAEQKIEMVRNPETKRMEILPKKSLTGLEGWLPITEKSVPFELTASFLLTADAPGIPKPIKLPEQLRPFFQLDRPIDEAAGRSIAEWAAGGTDLRQAHRTALDAATTLPELAAAFAAAQSAARDAKDHAAMVEFVRLKIEKKAALEAGYVTSTGAA